MRPPRIGTSAPMHPFSLLKVLILHLSKFYTNVRVHDTMPLRKPCTPILPNKRLAMSRMDGLIGGNGHGRYRPIGKFSCLATLIPDK
eukprot:scaffold6155_cov107-Amphora_coffeaeformis.AAC.1